MKLEIDDHIADDITIQSLEKDLALLKRTCDSINNLIDPDYVYSKKVIDAIETILAYYGKPQ